MLITRRTRPLKLRPREYSSSAPNSIAPPNAIIEKILIANRGEVACRIIRSAKRLGIRAEAVYSDADESSFHVKLADEAVRIGPPPARLSYLRAPPIIEAASRIGAQGFAFIGPPASTICVVGDKSASKRIMGAAGVSLVPGYHGDEQDIDLMKLEADRIGYPVLIKRTHGGGGKVAGLPTNIGFLLKIANHEAFENGEVETTHFIKMHRDDLSVDANDQLSTQQVYNAAVHGGAIAAACVCENEHKEMRENASDGRKQFFRSRAESSALKRPWFWSRTWWCKHDWQHICLPEGKDGVKVSKGLPILALEL